MLDGSLASHDGLEGGLPHSPPEIGVTQQEVDLALEPLPVMPGNLALLLEGS